MFSLGVLLFVMVLGLPPFRSARDSDGYFSRLRDRPANFWKIFRDFRLSEEFKELFQGLTQRNQDQRFGISEVKQSPWFRGEILGNDELHIEMEPRDKMLRAS